MVAASTLEDVAEDSFRKTSVAMGHVSTQFINGVASVKKHKSVD